MKKVLLDESLPRKLKNYIQDVCDPNTVIEMGWKAKSNGELLALASEASFEYFIIVDKNLVHQQNLSKFPIQIVLLDSYKNTLDALVPFMLEFKNLFINDRISEKYTIINIG